MAPRGPQDDPRRPQDGPKTTLRRPKTAPRRLQDAFESKRCLLHLSLGEEISRRSPKMAPKTHPRAPKRPQEAPTSPQEAPKRPPRGPPEVPRGSQKAPKRLPRRLQDAPKAILSKKQPNAAKHTKTLRKSMFFRHPKHPRWLQDGILPVCLLIGRAICRR